MCSSRATIERHRESAAGAKQLVRKASERALASVEQRRRSDAEVGAKTLVKQLSQKALHEAAGRTGASAHHSAYVAQRAGDSELPPSVSASAADHGSPGSPAGERGSVVAHFLQNGEGRMTEEGARAALNRSLQRKTGGRRASPEGNMRASRSTPSLPPLVSLEPDALVEEKLVEAINTQIWNDALAGAGDGVVGARNRVNFSRHRGNKSYRRMNASADLGVEFVNDYSPRAVPNDAMVSISKDLKRKYGEIKAEVERKERILGEQREQRRLRAERPEGAEGPEGAAGARAGAGAEGAGGGAMDGAMAGASAPAAAWLCRVLLGLDRLRRWRLGR